MKNEMYMRQAIELAKRGEGYVNPNPLVGCVVVKDGRVVTTGWHERYGGYHAERNALLHCEEDLRGAEMYVTLEPCCHTGQTPPCTDIIIERGIGTVYIGSDDPNPLVAGKGVEILEKAGIDVETHVLKEECDRLNEIFFHYITTHRPFVAMKYAMTLDGKITLASAGVRAGETGDATSCSPRTQTVITGPEAHRHVHLLRRRYAAIMVGIGTVLADDPMLNVRLEDQKDGCPVRVILDSHLRIPVESQIVRTAQEIPTIVVYTSAEESRCRELRERGVRTMAVGTDEYRETDLDEVFIRLGEEKLDSVLVEGGSQVHGSLLRRPGLVHRVYAYVAPKIFGGESALSPIGGIGITDANEALHLSDTEILSLGEDLLVTGRLV